jgi:hypothetical protein
MPLKFQKCALLLLLPFLIHCNTMPGKFNAKLEKTLLLENIPSGSGLEILNGNIYLLGDDAPRLFRLDAEDYRQLDSIRLLDFDGSRIPKKDKPDLEAMCAGIYEYEGSLLLFGSGGISPQRDSLLVVDIASAAVLKRISLAPFYTEIIRSCSLEREELNIEAAVVTGEKLYLLNRGKNIIIETNWNDFSASLQNSVSPAFSHYPVNLPEINNISAGFSGAGAIPGTNTFLFTATVENVPTAETGKKNWIADGEILGSFAGIVDIDMLKTGNALQSARLTGSNGETLLHKIESIAVKTKKGNEISAVAVADNDDGSSTILELTLTSPK